MIKYLVSVSLIVVLFAACKADKKEDTKAIQEKEKMYDHAVYECM